MNKNKLIDQWINEEENAKMLGWDFTHIKDRYVEEDDLPWDYKQIVKDIITSDKVLLDIDTGGAEFLLSLNHPYDKTFATEAYQPNVTFCRNKLTKLGIGFEEADAEKNLPFKDESFDIVINRHGCFNEKEIFRVLKKDGFFITQQVGAENDRDLVELLLNDVPPLPYPNQYLKKVRKLFELQGFTTIKAEEVFKPIKFYDVGALVWFAHIIEWEFPDFSVNKCLSNLFKAQEILEKDGEIKGRIHRFLLVLKK